MPHFPTCAVGVSTCIAYSTKAFAINENLPKSLKEGDINSLCRMLLSSCNDVEASLSLSEEPRPPGSPCGSELLCRAGTKSQRYSPGKTTVQEFHV